MNRTVIRSLAAMLANVLVFGWSAIGAAGELSSANDQQKGWTEFRAAGYAEPVCGVIYGLKDQVTNGMPLGGIDTGCIDLESSGVFGYSTLFNTHVPHRGGAAVRAPVLSLSVGGKTWALCGESAATETSLPHLASWLPDDLGPAQPGWGLSPTAVPGWAKSAGTSKHDIPRGRVFCHAPAVVRWTSLVAGEIEIRGGLWIVRNIGRVQKWELRKNGTALTSGQIAWGPTSRATQLYSRGSGGAGALKLAVAAGDRIELVLEKAAVCEDFVGVDLTIVAPAGKKTWDLAADWSDAQNPNGPWTYDDTRRRAFNLFRAGCLTGIQRAKEIRYWGHYPIADVQYETSAPVQVCLRAWSPFIPGALIDSIMPAAVFETHLRNASPQAQSGTIAFNFPGPSPEEAGGNSFQRSLIEGEFRGIEVKAPLASYCVGAIGQENVRFGAELGREEAAWASIGRTLPEPRPDQPGASAAVDFTLAPAEEKVVRFALTWHAPDWKGGGRAGSRTRHDRGRCKMASGSSHGGPGELLDAHGTSRDTIGGEAAEPLDRCGNPG